MHTHGYAHTRAWTVGSVLHDLRARAPAAAANAGAVCGTHAARGVGAGVERVRSLQCPTGPPATLYSWRHPPARGARPAPRPAAHTAHAPRPTCPRPPHERRQTRCTAARRRTARLQARPGCPYTRQRLGHDPPGARSCAADRLFGARSHAAEGLCGPKGGRSSVRRSLPCRRGSLRAKPRHGKVTGRIVYHNTALYCTTAQHKQITQNRSCDALTPHRVPRPVSPHTGIMRRCVRRALLLSRTQCA